MEIGKEEPAIVIEPIDEPIPNKEKMPAPSEPRVAPERETEKEPALV